MNLKKIPNKIFVFSHPDFLHIKSIERYANWIVEALSKKGYNVELVKPADIISKWVKNKVLKKYFGYIDSFFIFPFKIKSLVKENGKDSLYVIADQALGPWVKFFPKEKLVIHCHDFLAQLSALDNFPQNRLSKSGKIYQNYIQNGYRKAGNFICISEKTKKDLLDFLPNNKCRIEVIYNGVDPIFDLANLDENIIKKGSPYILHIGGNQWYKNRKGVIESFVSFRKKYIEDRIQLLLIGEPLSELQYQLVIENGLMNDIILKQNVSDIELIQYYSNAEMLLFPSVAEGFGWPIAEAMKCKLLVITTKDAPMDEVGGDAAFYIPQYDNSNNTEWSMIVAEKIYQVLKLSPEDKDSKIQSGKEQVVQFDSDLSISKIEKYYLDIFNQTI